MKILKEVIINLLLLIAIVLIMAVIFYDYNPINKVVPNKVQYIADENVKNEIEVNIPQMENNPMVYSIDGTDLNVYEKANTYVKGKANPFANPNTNVEEQKNENASKNTTNVVGKNVTNSQQSASSGNTFYNKTGTK